MRLRTFFVLLIHACLVVFNVYEFFYSEIIQTYIRRANDNAEYVLKDLASRIGIYPTMGSTSSIGGCVFLLLHTFMRIFPILKFMFINYWLVESSLVIKFYGYIRLQLQFNSYFQNNLMMARLLCLTGELL